MIKTLLRKEKMPQQGIFMGKSWVRLHKGNLSKNEIGVQPSECEIIIRIPLTFS